MPKYRRLPLLDEAVRNDGQWATVLAWLSSVGYEVPFLGEPAIRRNHDGSLSIRTLEGVMHCEVGAWLVQGDEGEFWPVKNSVFMRGRAPAEAMPLVDAALDFAACWREAMQEIAAIRPGITSMEAASAAELFRACGDWLTALAIADAHGAQGDGEGPGEPAGGAEGTAGGTRVTEPAADAEPPPCARCLDEPVAVPGAGPFGVYGQDCIDDCQGSTDPDHKCEVCAGGPA